MTRVAIKTDLAPGAIGPYSQAVKIGEMLFVSGQVPLDPNTGDLVSKKIEVQTKRVMDSLEAVLKAGGASFDSVVKTTIFLKDLEDFAAVNEVYGKHFTDPYPARACVEVARLPRDVLVEIDAIAQINSQVTE